MTQQTLPQQSMTQQPPPREQTHGGLVLQIIALCLSFQPRSQQMTRVPLVVTSLCSWYGFACHSSRLISPFPHFSSPVHRFFGADVTYSIQAAFCQCFLTPPLDNGKADTSAQKQSLCMYALWRQINLSSGCLLFLILKAKSRAPHKNSISIHLRVIVHHCNKNSRNRKLETFITLQSLGKKNISKPQGDS